MEFLADFPEGDFEKRSQFLNIRFTICDLRILTADYANCRGFIPRQYRTNRMERTNSDDNGNFNQATGKRGRNTDKNYGDRQDACPTADDAHAGGAGVAGEPGASEPRAEWQGQEPATAGAL
jgi:hypothetical protein